MSAIDAAPGLAETFRSEQGADRVDAVIGDLAALGVTRLRVVIPWAEWARDEAFQRATLARLSGRFDVLPSLDAQGLATPTDPTRFADWVEQVVGPHPNIAAVELVDDPAAVGLAAWRARIGAAAAWMRGRGRRVALGGPGVCEAAALDALAEAGALASVDAFGLRLTPDDPAWNGWSAGVDRARDRLARAGCDAEVWVTEASARSPRDPAHLVRALCGALRSGADRTWWWRARDAEETPGAGLRRADGSWTLAGRLWAHEGLDSLLLHERLTLARRPRPERYALVTGGAGFVGSNLAHRLATEGHRVVVLDDLSRPGVEANAVWLQETHGDEVVLEVGDVRDADKVRQLVAGADQVFHLAAQVAVTTSLVSPGHDFEVNARGTLNVLEAVRRRDDPPPLLFTSTNKVYGSLQDVALRRTALRHEPAAPDRREFGVAEERPLDFHSPYGCSKGAADQYVLDYARTYGLPTVVFRMSCIYGPRQFGTEDQGWVAHFLMRGLEGLPITIYGDGLQVRDALYVDDLLDAMLLARDRAHAIGGRAFNIGGGPQSTLSLIELIGWIERLQGARPDVVFEDWRTGDQRWYVSDTRSAREALSWAPKTPLAVGLVRLDDWLHRARHAERPQSGIAAAGKG